MQQNLSASNSTGGTYSAPKTCTWWGGGLMPSTPPDLGLSAFGLAAGSQLIFYNSKQEYA